MEMCVVHLSQKNRIGFDPFFVLDPGIIGINNLGIGFGNRESNLKIQNRESRTERLTIGKRNRKSNRDRKP